MRTTDELFTDLDFHLNHTFGLVQDFQSVLFFMKSPQYVLKQPDRDVREAAALLFTCAHALQDHMYEIKESDYGLEIYLQGNDKPINAN